MSQQYTPVEQEVLGLLHSLQHDMKTGFEQVDQRFDGIDGRLDRLSEDFGELREEFHAESIATRTLINQAFEHISDQISRERISPGTRVVTPRSRKETVSV